MSVLRGALGGRSPLRQMIFEAAQSGKALYRCSHRKPMIASR